MFISSGLVVAAKGLAKVVNCFGLNHGIRRSELNTLVCLGLLVLTARLAGAASVVSADGGTTVYGSCNGLAIDFDATPAASAVWSPVVVNGRSYTLASLAIKNAPGNTGNYYLGVYSGFSGGVLSGFQGVSDAPRDFAIAANDWLTFTFTNLNHSIVADATVGAGSGLRYFVYQAGTTAVASPSVILATERFTADTFLTNNLASVIAFGGLVANRSPQYQATITSAAEGGGSNSAALRRPISPNQPTWLVHIDSWNQADPQKFIDMIPADIRPFVIFNISISINHQRLPTQWLQTEYAYEVAKSWLRVCAENGVWAMIQQSSGGFQHFSETDLTVYEEFFREYPNFLGFNYAEQFWGFDSSLLAPADPNYDPISPAWPDRIALFAKLLKLANQYGGYLVVSWCPNQFDAGINPIAMLKRNPDFAAACRAYTENYILCEKYTQASYQFDMESTCLGAYLSGYSGQYGIRYDSTGWTDATGTNQNFTLATGIAPQLEHVMLTGETVIDGPETIPTQSSHEISTTTTVDGYTARRWEFFPQCLNINQDLFRKILDGTVRIPTRQEVIDRTKVVIVNDVSTGPDQDRYSSPQTLFEGLYRPDGDGNYELNRSFFKKTGRYPAVPTVYLLDDAPANSFAVKVNKSSYTSRWPSLAAKTNEFNTLFPAEYTGDLYAGRHENGWVIYNPYKTNQTASGSIPFKYNTADRVDVSLTRYSGGVLKEYANQLTVYLNNYDVQLDNSLKTNTLSIYGASAQPTWSFVNRGNAQAATPSVTGTWSGGVLTLAVVHNGPLDLTINCAGNATGRLTNYTAATITTPSAPMTYPGPRQHEAELFEYRSITGVTANGVGGSVRSYTGQGYLRFGTSSTASIRRVLRVNKAGAYRLDTRYSVEGGSRTGIDLYVNGARVTALTFPQTATFNDWAVLGQAVTLAAGTNLIEFRATATGARTIYFDNIVVVPTAYGDGLVIQENQPEFIAVDGAVENVNAGYTATGYARSANTNGASIYWSVSLDASVTKAFTFRYASTNVRTADLFINDTNVAANVSFPATGSLTNWSYVTVYARVPAGLSSVRLRSVSGGGLPNIDSLELIGGTAWVAGQSPFTPQLLVANPVSTAQINLAWPTTPGAATYNVKHAPTSGGPYTTIASAVAGNSFNHIGLPELSFHAYVVSAVNANGESANSKEVTATTLTTNTPAVPGSLTAVAASFDKVDLAWTAALGAERHNIKRALAVGGPFITVAINVVSNTYRDTGLFAGQTYYYVVSGLNQVGEGANSTVASVTMPTTLTLSPVMDTYVRDGGNANGIFGSSDQLQVKNDSAVGFTRNTFLKFNVSGLADAQSLRLKLTPYQVDGSATLAYELMNDDTWTDQITWNTQPSGSGNILSNVAGFVVGQQRIVDLTAAAKAEAAGDGIFSLKISQPSQVAIFLGFHSKESASTNLRPVLEYTISQNYPLPTAPTGLGAVAPYYNQINLSWAATAGAASYNIRRASVSGGPYALIATGVVTPSFNDTGRASQTTYFYRVSAVNGAGESANSGEVSATTPLVLPPAAPGGVAAVGLSTNQISLSWQPSAGAISYNVRRATTSGGAYTVVASGVTATNVIDGGLAVGAAYFYVVTAVSEIGESPNSQEVSAATWPLLRLLPFADAYVRNGIYADTVFGNDINLTVKTDTNTADASRITYLKFNVAALSNVANIKLSLTPSQVDGASSLLYEAWSNDSWSETGITWNNQPVGTGTTITSLSSYSLSTPVLIDVTAAARNQATNDGVLTIRITKTGSDFLRIDFCSKENATASFRPALEYVLSGNTSPTLTAVSDRVIGVGQTLNITNAATDPDLPAQALSYGLAAAPTNATINASSGVITWRPLVTQANSTNLFAVRASDTGVPSLSAMQSFRVLVTNLASPTISLPSIANNQLVLTVNGASGPDYQIQTSTNLVTWTPVLTTNAPGLPFVWTNAAMSEPVKFFRVQAGPPFNP